MSKKVLDICAQYNQDSLAKYIAHQWDTYSDQMRPTIERWKELRNYIFATDTTTTTNKSLPWKNSTTLPKLCQIRDNLHSNYLSALFPNDDWLRWEAYTESSAQKKKRKAIEAYMSNKVRESDFRTQVSQLLYDYIDYGNCFATVDYEASFRTNALGEKIPDYIGPKIRRISPLDIRFNPIATSFKDSFKIIRELKNISELHIMGLDEPENAYLQNALENRKELVAYANTYGIQESDKQEGLLVDGFGNYQEYLKSDYVEVLTFWGDIWDSVNSTLYRGKRVVVIDRMWVIHNDDYPTWFGYAPIFHAGWRKRPDNLWAMGPLDNLVGMQYRIDHLENAKADATDLAIHPPLVIQGEVEEFEWKPGTEIHIDENGAVTELARNVQWVIQADNAIDRLEARMEQFAGAPREAMGIRTAGEKTKYEVQALENAAGRIFQEKITMFEIELLERVLNAMLESAKRNLDRTDVIRVIDDDLGVTSFMEITKEDITASGVLRPIGARHFNAQALLVQNLTALSNTQIWQQISPHLQSQKLAALVEDVFSISRYDLFRPNAAVFEQQETARLASQAGENLLVEDQTAPPQ